MLWKVHPHKATRWSVQSQTLAGRINLVIIKTLHTTSEMVFDRYTAEFTALAVAFESLIVLEQSTTYQHTTERFACDNGLLNLVAFAAFRCRDPLLRGHLITLLAKADRAETAEGSFVWAGACRAAQVIEEEEFTKETGITTRSAADIGEEKTVRLYKMEFYWNSGWVRLVFSYPPYHSSSPPTSQANHQGSFYTHDSDPVLTTYANCFREAWIPLASVSGSTVVNDNEFGGGHARAIPNVIFGAGPRVAFLERPAHYSLAVPQYHDTWLANEQGLPPPRYITIEMNKFFFAIPKM